MAMIRFIYKDPKLTITKEFKADGNARRYAFKTGALMAWRNEIVIYPGPQPRTITGKPAPTNEVWEHIHTFTLEEALDILDTKEEFINVRGWTVKTTNLKYDLMRLNTDCVYCCDMGLTGRLETNKTSRPKNRAFINFYTSEYMLTKDHIMPKARRGPDRLWNFQTMCTRCQNVKKAGLPATDRFDHPHNYYTDKEFRQEELLAERFGARETDTQWNGPIEITCHAIG